MEFTDIGVHCAVQSCNKQDFLPFKCDSCQLSFCLEHRTYMEHGCNGYAQKDVTSIECPICHNSIKFTKSQNADEAWENHFVIDCLNKSKTQENQTIRCTCQDCNTVLGPSNTFICPKCHKKVCLSHRFPEDHHCAGIIKNLQKMNVKTTAAPIMSSTPSKAEFPISNSSSIDSSRNPQLRNEAFLSKLESESKQKSSTSIKGTMKSTSSTTTTNYNRNANTTTTQKKLDNSNNNNNSSTNSTLHKSQYQQNESTNRNTNIPTFEESCPHCFACFSDPVALIQHCETAHTDTTSRNDGTFNSNPSSSSRDDSYSGSNSSCPQCGATFSDPIALVSHFESFHNGKTNNTPVPRKSPSKMGDCVLN